MLLKAEVVMDGRADTCFEKMFGFIGSLLSIAGLTLMNPCSCFFNKKILGKVLITPKLKCKALCSNMCAGS